MKSEPTKLVEEYLEIPAVADDIEPSAYLITDDIAYTLSPSGHVFRGAKAMAVFAKTTGGERTHDAGYKINITNWFADDGHLCIEYTHGFNSLFGLPIKVRNAAVICLVGGGGMLLWRRRAGASCVPGTVCSRPVPAALVTSALSLGAVLTALGFIFA